jgi:hypothetical protein
VRERHRNEHPRRLCRGNASRGVQLVIAAAAEGMQAAFAINSALLDADAASNALRDQARPTALRRDKRLLTKWSCERRARVCRVPADLVAYPEEASGLFRARIRGL